MQVKCSHGCCMDNWTSQVRRQQVNNGFRLTYLIVAFSCRCPCKICDVVWAIWKFECHLNKIQKARAVMLLVQVDQRNVRSMLCNSVTWLVHNCRCLGNQFNLHRKHRTIWMARYIEQMLHDQCMLWCKMLLFWSRMMLYPWLAVGQHNVFNVELHIQFSNPIAILVTLLARVCQNHNGGCLHVTCVNCDSMLQFALCRLHYEFSLWPYGVLHMHGSCITG